MQLSDIPAWIWQVVGAAAGLGLGLGLGAWHLRRSKPARRRATRPSEAPAKTGHSSGLPSEAAASQLHSQFSGRRETPQERLLERLREQNLDLGAQLRASAAQHARLLRDKDEEVAALKDDYDQRVEELRQIHSSELKYLMALLVEQVDGLHKTHASQVRALEAELERLKGTDPARQEPGDTTTFAHTETMGVRPRGPLN